MNDNWGLIGHKWAVELLRGHIHTGRIRHAYLISGAQSVGRKSLALAIAKAVNCQQPPEEGEFCGTCRACSLIERGEHPDLHIVERGKESLDLKIDQIRELQRSLALTPYEANYRIALLPDFETANQSAANALLKTLEEPNPKVILLLTAASAELLLPTITSRCDLVRLRTPSISETAAGLEQLQGLGQQEAHHLPQLAGGRPGMALRLAQDPDSQEGRRQRLEDLVTLIHAPIRERFKTAEALSRNRKGLSRAEQLSNLRVLIQSWESYWRDILLLKTTGESIAVNNPDFLEEMETSARQHTLRSLETKLKALERALVYLEANANIRLTLESLLLDL